MASLVLLDLGAANPSPAFVEGTVRDVTSSFRVQGRTAYVSASLGKRYAGRGRGKLLADWGKQPCYAVASPPTERPRGQQPAALSVKGGIGPMTLRSICPWRHALPIPLRATHQAVRIPWQLIGSVM